MAFPVFLSFVMRLARINEKDRSDVQGKDREIKKEAMEIARWKGTQKNLAETSDFFLCWVRSGAFRISGMRVAKYISLHIFYLYIFFTLSTKLVFILFLQQLFASIKHGIRILSFFQTPLFFAH